LLAAINFYFIELVGLFEISCKHQKSSVRRGKSETGAEKRQGTTILPIKPKMMSNLSVLLDILTR
ncbi:MAG: hypothetical protein ACKO8H_17370, partial [Microcystis panniformis]